MSHSNVASLSSGDILKLLDDEELSELAKDLLDRNEKDSGKFAHLSSTQTLLEVSRLRLPFIRMMSEICDVLNSLEARIQGNIRLIVMPQVVSEIQSALSPQMRKAMADIINANLIASYSVSVKDKCNAMSRSIEKVADQCVPTTVYHETDRSREARQHPYTAANANMFRRPSREFNAQDWENLQYFMKQLEDLQCLLKKESSRSSVIADAVICDLQISINRLHGSLALTLALGSPSRGKCETPSILEARHLAVAKEDLVRFQEILFAVSNFTTSSDVFYNFHNLEIWKQRWRVYELWVLTRVLSLMLDLGATVSDASRIVDGLWNLKFSRDTKPVLSLELEGEVIDIHYQLYQSRTGAGDMPDLAVSIRGRRFIAIIDPKHGKSYRHLDLVSVCERYATSFDPHLSLICNYFETPAIANIQSASRAMVVYGLKPSSVKSINVFERALIGALQAEFGLIGRRLTRTPCLIVLFDASGSCEGFREPLLQQFRLELSILTRRPSSESVALLFGEGIVRTGRITDLEDTTLFRGISLLGTDFELSVRTALCHLERLPLHVQFWIFTDGVGLGDPLTLETELNPIGSQTLFVEAGKSNLLPLAKAIGGRHLELPSQ